MTRRQVEHEVVDLEGTAYILLDTLDSNRRKLTGDDYERDEDVINAGGDYQDGKHRPGVEPFVTATSFALGSHLESEELLAGGVVKELPLAERLKIRGGSSFVLTDKRSEGYASGHYQKRMG